MSHIEQCLVCEINEYPLTRKYLTDFRDWPCKNKEGDVVIDRDTLGEYINNDVWEDENVETLNEAEALCDELDRKNATIAYLKGSE